MARVGAACCAVWALLAVAPALAAPPSSEPQRQSIVVAPSLSSIVERVLPAVVSIAVTISGKTASETAATGSTLDRMLRRFREQGATATPHGARGATGLGSGFIIDPTGYIVTNYHLVAEAEGGTVTLQDKSRHSAQIIGRDDITDIALIKIDAQRPLPFVRWADSDSAKVGDWVLAVGNPYGLEGTVTAGILSARGRDIDEGPYDDFLQIDAPINRGNSGGPTFNLDGEVLGINTAIFSPSGGSIGIGFAIPAAFARTIVAQLKAKGRADHGWLGVTMQNVTPAIARSFAIDPENPAGALVDDVTPDSPAARAGIRQGDVILSINGRPVTVARDLPRIVRENQIGQRIALMLRRDGRDRKASAVIGLMPGQPRMASLETEGAGSSLPQPRGIGVDLQAITPDLRKRLQIPKSVDGVYVADITPASPAGALGLKSGDVIVSVDRRKVSSPADCTQRLDAAFATGQVLLLVHRDGGSQFLGAALEERAPTP
jgi:serine protease Do